MISKLIKDDKGYITLDICDENSERHLNLFLTRKQLQYLFDMSLAQIEKKYLGGCSK